MRLPLLWSESRKHECRSFGIADDQRRVSELERVLVFICEAVFKNSIVSSTLFETCGTPCCLGADRRPPWPLPWGGSVLLGDVSGTSAFIVLATRSPSSALSSCAGRDLRVGSSLETQTVRPPPPRCMGKRAGGGDAGGVRLGSPLLQWACAFPECSAEPGGRGAIPVLPSLSLTALVSSVNSRGPTCPCFGLQQSCPPTKLLPVGVLSHLAGQVSRAATCPPLQCQSLILTRLFPTRGFRF